MITSVQCETYLAECRVLGKRQIFQCAALPP
jgi:hypothetical protein